MSKFPQPPELKDGTYKARCKESTQLKAAINGHSQVWPEADLTIREGWASFSKDGIVVWKCNSGYASLHFKVTATAC
ncbi:hypothetical protein H8F21_15030 [Pseudomonas sp. P66]|uniref:Uncharacterized protein n=1 Tax=Pseudomonas arcuscaelestis TaxID=2710591 RepID=A0ABS2BZ28_9PSED|nr:hypothetical protein [Pseudomonas arcuscaelestis]MBM5458878.1 hypothetical protein [Pseudomonas arcuscaelestis]